ncbi:MAG: outer membrane beta-barrel domain-containing protein [Bdellovibrio sp.]
MITKVSKFFIFITLLLTTSAQAQTIEFDSDELPTESVVALLDSNMAVKNKAISFRNRLEVGFSFGAIIDEMFYNNTAFGLQLYYNFNEEQSIGLKYSDRLSGVSDYSKQFEDTTTSLQMDRAPAPSSIIAGTYRWTFLYGKMSLSKDLTLPTVFSLEADLGVNKYGSQSLPYSAVGVNQKLYIKKHIGVGLTYRIMVYQTLDPMSVKLGQAQPVPDESAFDKKMQISQGLDLGVSYLF